MGCNCGRGNSALRRTPSAIPKPIITKTPVFSLGTKPCPICGKRMTGINKYIIATKKLVKIWICENRNCRYKTQ